MEISLRFPAKGNDGPEDSMVLNSFEFLIFRFVSASNLVISPLRSLSLMFKNNQKKSPSTFFYSLTTVGRSKSIN